MSFWITFVWVLVGLIAGALVALGLSVLATKDHGRNVRAIVAGIAVFLIIQAIAVTVQVVVGRKSESVPTATVTTAPKSPRPTQTEWTESSTPVVVESPQTSPESSGMPSPNSPPVSKLPTPTKSEIPPSAANPLWLADIDRGEFIRTSNHLSRGNASIDGKDYAKSYFYDIHNCSSCTSIDTFNIPRVYTRMRGTFGLTDDTRHDEVIDGVVFASIYAGEQLVYGPKRVECPNSVKFDIRIKTSRISLKVEDGTNFEHPVWANVRFEY